MRLFVNFNGYGHTAQDDDDFNFYIATVKAMDEKTTSGLALLQSTQEKTLVSLVKYEGE